MCVGEGLDSIEVSFAIEGLTRATTELVQSGRMCPMCIFWKNGPKHPELNPKGQETQPYTCTIQLKRYTPSWRGLGMPWLHSG